MRIKILAFFVFATLTNFAVADLYKCKTISGSTGYQSAPCPKSQTSKQEVIQTKQTAEPYNSAPDNEKMSMDFDKIGLNYALQVVADFAGKQLQFSKTIQDHDIQLHFKKVGWRDVLKKIAADNHVSIYVENDLIKVNP